MRTPGTPLLGREDVFFDVKYFTPLSLLLSPFVIGQTIFNVVASFSIVLFFFWMIFVEIGEPVYKCSSSEALSPYIISPFACSILALAWAPVGMIDAVERGWYGPIRRHDLVGIWNCFRVFAHKSVLSATSSSRLNWASSAFLLC